MNLNLIAQILSTVTTLFGAFTSGIASNSSSIVVPQPTVDGVTTEEQQAIAQFYVAHPLATAQEGHYAWVATKEAAGWKRGDVYDAEKKTHPSLVVWEELPGHLQLKNALTQQVASQLVNLLPISDKAKVNIQTAANVASKVFTEVGGNN